MIVTTQERVLLTSSGERPRTLLKHSTVHRARKKHPVKIPIVPQWRNSALKEDGFPPQDVTRLKPSALLTVLLKPGTPREMQKEKG